MALCLGSDRPDGQAVHPRAKLRRSLHLIPVSGVGEVVGGVSEVVGAKKIRGNGVEGMFSKDMTDDKMTCEARKLS